MCNACMTYFKSREEDVSTFRTSIGGWPRVRRLYWKIYFCWSIVRIKNTFCLLLSDQELKETRGYRWRRESFPSFSQFQTLLPSFSFILFSSSLICSLFFFKWKDERPSVEKGNGVFSFISSILRPSLSCLYFFLSLSRPMKKSTRWTIYSRKQTIPEIDDVINDGEGLTFTLLSFIFPSFFFPFFHFPFIFLDMRGWGLNHAFPGFTKNGQFPKEWRHQPGRWDPSLPPFFFFNERIRAPKWEDLGPLLYFSNFSSSSFISLHFLFFFLHFSFIQFTLNEW